MERKKEGKTDRERERERERALNSAMEKINFAEFLCFGKFGDIVQLERHIRLRPERNRIIRLSLAISYHEIRWKLSGMEAVNPLPDIRSSTK